MFYRNQSIIDIAKIRASVLYVFKFTWLSYKYFTCSIRSKHTGPSNELGYRIYVCRVTKDSNICNLFIQT
jgi:hypothetical protein